MTKLRNLQYSTVFFFFPLHTVLLIQSSKVPWKGHSFPIHEREKSGLERMQFTQDHSTSICPEIKTNSKDFFYMTCLSHFKDQFLKL